MSENRTLMLNGMWNNNPALVQLLGLCPLLAVSSTVTNALGLGIATLLFSSARMSPSLSCVIMCRKKSEFRCS